MTSTVHPLQPRAPGQRNCAAERMIGWLHEASIEVVPPKPSGLATLKAHFDPGATVYVNFLPDSDYDASVAAVAELRRAGFAPVPHISARSVRDAGELGPFIDALVDAGDLDRVLVIAGDQPEPLGPFNSTTDLLKSGLLARPGIEWIGIAGHPEAPPRADLARMDAALCDKLEAVADQGKRAYIITQFCFAAEPIVDFFARLNAMQIDAPVRIGVAGPATVPMLIRFGTRCGVGASLQTLKLKSQVVGQPVGDSGPEEILRDVAAGLCAAGDRRDVGVHFFPFGGVAKTGEWIAASLSVLYDQVTPGEPR